MHGYGFDGGYGMLGGGLVMWLLWIAIFAAIAFGVLQIARSGNEPDASSPRRLLDERYARGEIGREEYLQKLDDLGRGASPGGSA